jgi:hypothetical protein
MTIKSLFVALGISISGLSAAESAQPGPLNELVIGVAAGTKTTEDMRLYVRDLQARVYDSVDSGDLATAEKYFEAATDSLLPMFAAMSNEDCSKSSVETLFLIEDYIRIHTQR